MQWLIGILSLAFLGLTAAVGWLARKVSQVDIAEMKIEDLERDLRRRDVAEEEMADAEDDIRAIPDSTLGRLLRWKRGNGGPPEDAET